MPFKYIYFICVMYEVVTYFLKERGKGMSKEMKKKRKENLIF